MISAGLPDFFIDSRENKAMLGEPQIDIQASKVKQPTNSDTAGGGCGKKPPSEPPSAPSAGGSGSGSEISDEGSVVSLGDSKVTMYKRKKVKGHSLHDMSDALRHHVVLALQEANILDNDEQLTEFAINNAIEIMDGSALKNKSVIAVLIKDGSFIKDWAKLSTQTIKISTGQKIQVHFYKNRVTGKIDYTHCDYKVKNPVDALAVNQKNPGAM